MMSLEPGGALKASSPPSSRSSSPANPKARAGAEEEALKKDKNYRRYASGVERALSLFDTALQEWADYISFLGRLLKALQARPTNITIIPSKSIVAKRLAQCLNPILPSGVHQKALEVYSSIFSITGADGLSGDLGLYLPGLSSTLSFASLSVRPAFLSLVESYLVTLDASALRPALKAIILCLLPGLEEESSDDFERTLKLLNEFRRVVGGRQATSSDQDDGSDDQYFWQCLFLASITSPNKRPGALAYLVRSLPKLGYSPGLHRGTSSETNGSTDGPRLLPAAESVLSPEPGLLIRCFAAGLGDDQLLIQRGFLDLLVTHLPLHSIVLQEQVTDKDLELLVMAATRVVTRRDMSLNRRLWTWFLGSIDPSSEEENIPSTPNSPSLVNGNTTPGHSDRRRTHYFGQYGLQSLITGLLSMINQDSHVPAIRVRPFRICLSLMDRWEVGGLVIPEIFLALVNSVRQYEDVAKSKDDFNEVLRSGNVFFDGIESGLIWAEILGQLTAALGVETADNRQDMRESLTIAKFMITRFNLREEEMLVVHIPTVTLALLSMLEIRGSSNLPSSTTNSVAFVEVSASALSIAQILVDLAPERAFRMKPSGQLSPSLSRQAHQTPLQARDIVSSIKKFYLQDHGNLEVSNPPVATHDIGELLVRELIVLLIRNLCSSVHVSELEASVSLLSALLRKLPASSIVHDDQLFSAIQQALKQSATPVQAELPFPALYAIISCLVSFSQAAVSGPYFTNEQLSHLTPILVRRLWIFLAPANPKYHVEAVRCIWRLHAMTLQDQLVEASIATLMLDGFNDGKKGLNSDACGRFAILWTHCLQSSHGLSESSIIRPSKSFNEFKKDASLQAQEKLLSRPLLMLLGALVDEGTETSIFVRAWLQNLPSVFSVFQIIVAKLESLPGITGSDDREEQNQIDDVDECRYYIQTIQNVLQCIPEDIWFLLATQVLRAGDEQVDMSSKDAGRFEQEQSFQTTIVKMCLQILGRDSALSDLKLRAKMSRLHTTVLLLIKTFLVGPTSMALAQLKLENVLIGRLIGYLDRRDVFVQVALLDTLYVALKLQVLQTSPSLAENHRRTTSSETLRSVSRLSLNTDRDGKEQATPKPPLLPPRLLDCLTAGLSSQGSRLILDSWILFLGNCLPLYQDMIYQVLIPLVECFCRNVRGVFEDLQRNFRRADPKLAGDPEPVLMLLLNGLEQTLARGHERLATEEMKSVISKSPEQPQGFFGNMVSGVFTSDMPRLRTQSANRRLTVLLCFRDTVSMCYDIWSWGSSGFDGNTQDLTSVSSFSYTSIRLRNRARRTMEHLFAAEALECLETLIEIWRKSHATSSQSQSASVFNLLHALDGSRPKNTMPAIFNAVYSRTNPSALEPARKSTLTSNLTDTELVTFLVHYGRSLEDDAMDEIWNDCMTFLRDVLANPFPHRQTLPRLLEFAAILGEKVDNTIFGEQRRIRRDLADVFTRLLSGIFTTRPLGFSHEASQTPGLEKPTLDSISSQQIPEPGLHAGSDDIVVILQSILPNLPRILLDQDRVIATATAISTNIIAPLFRSRSFPNNISKSTLKLLSGLSRIPNAPKSWKKDLSDGFNDPKFFSTSLDLVEDGWLPLLKQWISTGKDRIPDLISRLTPPTTARIMFGVGASSARLEADRKTQLNLRRIALVILAASQDEFVANLRVLEDKLLDLLAATAASSPSSATRAEVYMVLRALLLTTSTVHLSSLWPAVDSELQSAISSIFPEEQDAIYNELSILQACKLLDALLTMAPDEFQVHEWLFITDTIDAVYKPSSWNPIALADKLSEQLGSSSSNSSSQMAVTTSPTSVSHSRRKPLLSQIDTKFSTREELIGNILRPFFSQLSIYAFESTYSMGEPDRGTCMKDLLADIFDDTTMAG